MDTPGRTSAIRPRKPPAAPGPQLIGLEPIAAFRSAPAKVSLALFQKYGTNFAVRAFCRPGDWNGLIPENRLKGSGRLVGKKAAKALRRCKLFLLPV